MAQFSYASKVEHGVGVPANSEEAFKYHQMAADQGLALSQVTCGQWLASVREHREMTWQQLSIVNSPRIRETRMGSSTTVVACVMGLALPKTPHLPSGTWDWPVRKVGNSQGKPAIDLLCESHSVNEWTIVNLGPTTFF
jgi:hypothetical protein